MQYLAGGFLVVVAIVVVVAVVAIIASIAAGALLAELLKNEDTQKVLAGLIVGGCGLGLLFAVGEGLAKAAGSVPWDTLFVGGAILGAAGLSMWLVGRIGKPVYLNVQQELRFRRKQKAMVGDLLATAELDERLIREKEQQVQSTAAAKVKKAESNLQKNARAGEKMISQYKKTLDKRTREVLRG